MDTAIIVPLMNVNRYMVKMNKVMFGQTEMCKEGDTFCKALIDTGSTCIRGPKEKMTNFLQDNLGELPNECIS